MFTISKQVLTTKYKNGNQCKDNNCNYDVDVFHCIVCLIKEAISNFETASH